MTPEMARHILYLIQNTAKSSATDATITLIEIQRLCENNLHHESTEMYIQEHA